ncbi:MAG: histidine kinase [Chloroflexota bacterium]
MTLTYTAVTGGVFLVLWLGLMWLALSLSRATTGSAAGRALFSIVEAETAVYLTQTPIDQQGLQTYLDLWVSGDTLRIENDSNTISTIYNGLQFVAVTDLEGQLLAVEPQSLEFGSIKPQLTDAVLTLWETAVENGSSEFGLVDTYRGETAFYHVMPIESQRQRVGVLLIAYSEESTDDEFAQAFQPVVLGMSVVILCGSLLVGTFFGWLASRGVVRRLGRLETAASAWAEGDFSQKVVDKSQDEIGQLGQNLNQMADKLDQLLVTETALASVEERNRLARDLHDTAKQQLFSASMQLSSARELLHHNPEKAAELLQNVDVLTDQVQTELTSLIHALRPAALQNLGLAGAIKQYVDEWSERLGLQAEVAVQHERPLPISVEQALYRVLQEGLANVVKHANATHVWVQLRYQKETVVLQIRDNGDGFIPSEVQRGVGLHSMNERLAAINGLVTVDSQLGKGTELTAVVEGINE